MQLAPTLGMIMGQPALFGGLPQAQVGFFWFGMQASLWHDEQLQTVPSGKPHDTWVVQASPLFGIEAGQPPVPGVGQMPPVVMSAQTPFWQVKDWRQDESTLSP